MINKPRIIKNFILTIVVLLSSSFFLGCVSNEKKQPIDQRQKNQELTEPWGRASGNILNGGWVSEDNEAIYISYGSFYKVSKRDSKVITLYKNPVNYINYYKGWLYFTDSTRKNNIIRMKTTDSNKVELLLKEDCSSVMVLDDWIYCVVHSKEESNLIKLRIDGSQKVVLVKGIESDFTVLNNSLIYNKDGILIKSDLNGLSQQLLSNDQAFSFNLVKDTIFYIKEKDNKIYSLNINNKENVVITKYANSMNSWGEFLFFVTGQDQYLYKYNIKTAQLNKLTLGDNKTVIESINIANDKVYYMLNYGGESEAFKVDLDGKNINKIDFLGSIL